MTDQIVVGVDLGGTKVSAGKISGQKILKTSTAPVSAQSSQQVVMEEVKSAIEQVFSPEVKGIGIGVPSVVDVATGVVYDVQNIPSWQEVPLKREMEEYFKVPVYIDNDANCFAVGEKYYGQGQGVDNMVGLVLGTGAAAGIINLGRLYHGYNCGAGEYGMIPYLDHHYEHYCSGNFFKQYYQAGGEELFKLAQQQDAGALKAFQEFGRHLGNLITAILYAQDPELIVLGGSVSKAHDYFKNSMWEALGSFAYRKTISRLQIKLSTHPQIAILGSSALYHEFVDDPIAPDG